MKKKFYNALYVAIIADALSVPVEFCPPQKFNE